MELLPFVFDVNIEFLVFVYRSLSRWPFFNYRTFHRDFHNPVVICALEISYNFLIALRRSSVLLAGELLTRGHCRTFLHLESGLLLLNCELVGKDTHIAGNAIGDRVVLF